MGIRIHSKINPKKKYLQIALNGTLEDAKSIIDNLPLSDRIIVEAGTPFIKRYGEQGIRQICDWYQTHLFARMVNPAIATNLSRETLFSLLKPVVQKNFTQNALKDAVLPYVVADLKTMDRGETEVEMAKRAGASAAIALGSAPAETLNSFISACETHGLDAMIDMMNVAFPLSVLRALKKVPPVVILHRGVDEERDNREKQIPLHEIRRIKGNYNIMISIAGGDTLREVQRAIFNDADIVVIWKSVFQKTEETMELVHGFLKVIK